MSDVQNQNLIVPIFKIHSVQNDAKSKEKGRPVFDDMEVVEIRMAGNKQTVGVFPAHEIWKWVDEVDGTRTPTTYAMRWPELYRKFKEGAVQMQSGTPLEEAPFLSQGKRLELKALNIHTVDALAALDGSPLKVLGVGGRELKNQAKAYLEKAEGSAVETRLAAENETLRQQIADLQEQFSRFQTTTAGKVKAADIESADEADDDVGNDDGDGGEGEEGDGDANPDSPFHDWDDADIKAWIADAQGSKPKGNPSHATLVRMADDINAEIAKKNGNA